MKIYIAKKSLELSVLDANSDWLNCAGFKSLEDAIGKNDTHCAWAEFSEIYKQHEQDTLNENVYAAIFPGKTAADRFVWFYNYKYPEYDNQGKVVGLNVFAHEIIDFRINNVIKQLFHFNKYNCSHFLLNKKLEENLTRRETEILFYILYLQSSRKISEILNISIRTVEEHIAKIKFKLKCRSKAQIIEYAFSKGYVKIVPSLAFQKVLPDDFFEF